MSNATAQPRTINQARTLANIATRANSLLSDGYTIEPADEMPGVYYVFKPNRPATGLYWPFYIVDAEMSTCDCPAFARYNECKHRLAVATKLAEDEDADYRASLEEERIHWLTGSFACTF